MQTVYVIYCPDEKAYWVTNYLGTDNFTTDLYDATLFKDLSAVWAIMKTFEMKDCIVKTYFIDFFNMLEVWG